MDALHQKYAVNGSNFSFTCPFSPGSPNATSFLWRRTSDNRTWNTETLTLMPVNYLIDDTDFFCTANNTMEPSIGLPQQGISNGKLRITVWCEF